MPLSLSGSLLVPTDSRLRPVFERPWVVGMWYEPLLGPSLEAWTSVALGVDAAASETALVGETVRLLMKMHQ